MSINYRKPSTEYRVPTTNRKPQTMRSLRLRMVPRNAKRLLSTANCKPITFIALILCILIITIPITFAAELKIRYFGGLIGNENFVRAQDEISIKAIPVFDEELGDLSKEELEALVKRVKVSKDAGETYTEFQTCEKKDGKIVCTYEERFDDFYHFMTYNITLLDVLGNELVTETRRAVMDNEKPVIKKFFSKYNTTGDNKLELSYDVEDYINSSKKIDYCSGISEINFTIAGQVIKSINGNISVCEKSGSFVYEHAMESNFESFNICAQVFDFVGFRSDKKCLQTTVDQGIPLIYGLKVRDSEGFTLTHVRPDLSTSVDVFATIEDEHLSLESISADFSRLNPNLVSQKYDEQLKDNVFVWRNVIVASPQSCEVKITASDTLGNPSEKTLSCSIRTDGRKPRVLSIYTQATSDEGLPLLASSGKIFVDIQDFDDFGDIGSGFDKKNVFMGLDTLGMRKTQADACVQSGNIWKCSWFVAPTVEGGKKVIKFDSSSADDLGNSVENPFERIIDFDNIPPEIVEKDFKILHKSGNETIAGDTVEMRITASDVFEAFGNFSDVGGSERARAVCEGNICLFSSEILASGPYTGDLTFDLFDKAGNKATVVHQVSVFGVSDVKNPNFWNLKTVSCSPKLIDRSTGTLREQKVYCYARLSPINPRVKPTPVKTMFSGPTECTPFDLLSRFVQNIDLTNNGVGSKDLYLEFTLKPAEYSVNELKFSCPVSILTKTDTFTTSNAEVDNIDVKIQFYNLPLGELNANIEKKIDHEIKASGSSLKWINSLQKVVDGLTKTCQIKAIITSLLSILGMIGFFLGLTANTVSVIPLIGTAIGQAIDQARKGVTCGAKDNTETVYDGIWGVLNEACALVNCQLSDSKSGAWSLSSVGGGGIGGYCATIQEYLSSILPEGQKAINIKESIIWSTVCLCIPGIIYNLNKFRQISCRNALCYAKDVRDYGVPSFHCDDVKAYMTCNFIVGEVFNMIPFLNVVNDFLGQIKEMFINPAAIVAVATNLLCRVICYVPWAAPAYQVCDYLKLAAKIGDAIGSVSSIVSPDYWSIGTHYCNELEKVEKKRKQKKVGSNA